MKRQVMLVLRLVGLVAVLAAGMATSLALADPAHKHKHSDSATDVSSTETDDNKTDTGNTDTTPTDTTPTDTTPTDTTPTDTTPTTTPLGPSAQALPPATLDGEILLSSPSQQACQNQNCAVTVSECTNNGDGTLSFSFAASGVVTGGFYAPGTFSEKGKVTFTFDHFVGTAAAGPATTFDVSFKIKSPNGTVTGEKHLAGTSGALCTSPDTQQNLIRNAASTPDELAYTATIKTPGCTFTDQGKVLTFVDYDKFNGEFVEASPSLTENFTSTEQPVCGKSGGGGDARRDRHGQNNDRNRDNGLDDAPQIPVAPPPASQAGVPFHRFDVVGPRSCRVFGGHREIGVGHPTRVFPTASWPGPPTNPQMVTWRTTLQAWSGSRWRAVLSTPATWAGSNGGGPGGFVQPSPSFPGAVSGIAISGWLNSVTKEGVDIYQYGSPQLPVSFVTGRRYRIVQTLQWGDPGAIPDVGRATSPAFQWTARNTCVPARITPPNPPKPPFTG